MTGLVRNEIDVLLADSLKKLAAGKPIEKITIKEITDKAGVIRPTFYNHFQDKYELLEWIIDTELLEPVRPLLEAEMITEAMTLLFTNVEKDKAFYSRAVRMDGAVTFNQVATQCVERFLRDVFGKKQEKVMQELRAKQGTHRWLTIDIVSAYYAQSIYFAAEKWILQGMQVPPREVAEAYMFLLTHSMKDIIR